MTITRDHVRARFAASGLTYTDLTDHDLVDLGRELDRAMRASTCIGGSYRITRHKLRWQGTHRNPWAQLRCRSDYFETREAITFGPDGFIGFAGWAEDNNVQPILTGFLSWLEKKRATTSAKAKVEEDKSTLLRRAAQQAADALEPLAGCVFNDNGDISINLTITPTPGDCERAYFMQRQLRALLATMPEKSSC